jgi:hypothetical protein
MMSHQNLAHARAAALVVVVVCLNLNLLQPPRDLLRPSCVWACRAMIYRRNIRGVTHPPADQPASGQRYCSAMHASMDDGFGSTCKLYMSNGPCRAGPARARHAGHQSKPGTVWYRAGPGRPAGWLTRLRPGTVILTRAVPGRRHGGPVVPGRARSHKHKKHSKIQNLKVLFKFILDLVNYIYNFRYIFRQRISNTHINTYHKSECSHIITYYKYYN